jgi:hypothetical protein
VSYVRYTQKIQYGRSRTLQVPRSVDLGPPRVVHFQRECFHRYIGRPSRLGNPFVIGRDGTREAVIAKHAIYVSEHPELLPLILSLRGLVLGCWCGEQSCHGDLYIRMANAPIPPLAVRSAA